VSERSLAAFVAAAVAAAIVAGLIALGSPALARERRFDQRRVDDLSDIVFAIHDHQSSHRALPRSLKDLEHSGQDVNLRDPLTREPYEYRALDDARFELCAIFQQPSHPSAAARYWTHAQGRQCFNRRAAKGSDQ
jgi:hypothetical protein